MLMMTSYFELVMAFFIGMITSSCYARLNAQVSSSKLLLFPHRSQNMWGVTAKKQRLQTANKNFTTKKSKHMEKKHTKKYKSHLIDRDNIYILLTIKELS